MKSFKTVANLIGYLQHRKTIRACTEVHNRIVWSHGKPCDILTPAHTGEIVIMSGNFPDAALDGRVYASSREIPGRWVITEIVSR